MAERRSRKFSILIFLFALFILLAFMTGAYLYRIYTDNMRYSTEKTKATVDCDRYYFDINSVSYDGSTLEFEIENTLGIDIHSITIETSALNKTLNISLGQGDAYPVSLNIQASGDILIYPDSCRIIAEKLKQ